MAPLRPFMMLFKGSLIQLPSFAIARGGEKGKKPGQRHGHETQKAKEYHPIPEPQGQGTRSRVEGRTQQQEIFQPDSQDHNRTENDHQQGPGFDPSIDENQEGDEKGKTEDRPGQLPPGQNHDPLNDETGLFGYVAVPDDHQLAVKEITP